MTALSVIFLQKAIDIQAFNRDKGDMSSSYVIEYAILFRVKIL